MGVNTRCINSTRDISYAVRRFGLAVRTSVRYRFGSLFTSKRLWFVDAVLWLCPPLPTETLKWLSSLPILMQESFWWWQCSDRHILSLSPHLHTPFSSSLISLMVSVDVYLLISYASYPNGTVVPVNCLVIFTLSCCLLRGKKIHSAIYHWRELPQIWFLSRQKFCRD